MRDELVRVKRFDELATGMRVVVKRCRFCTSSHALILLNSDGDGDFNVSPDPGCTPIRAVIHPTAVRERRVYRFASDLGITDTVAAEQNPYTARTVVGTGGREETRTLTRERGR